jgi:hypothetical protein
LFAAARQGVYQMLSIFLPSFILHGYCNNGSGGRNTFVILLIGKEAQKQIDRQQPALHISPLDSAVFNLGNGCLANSKNGTT